MARASGQSTDLDRGLAAESLAHLKAAAHLPRGEGKPFGEEKPAPPDAVPADRLAAFMGREVG